MEGFGAFYELEIACRGIPDGHSGYIVNISSLDQVIRREALPEIQAAVHDRYGQTPAAVLRRIAMRIAERALPGITVLRWRLSPFYSLELETEDVNRIMMTQQFSFSAAHRLNCDGLSPEQNRALFGKCNNLHGHGHNYRLEVTVAASLEPEPDAQIPSVSLMDEVVDRHVIQRFDHRHLNLDVAEFAQLNPSVENIARVCHDLLFEPLGSVGLALRSVTVWETEKTRCTYST